ncbi:transcriptional regulator TbsP [Natronomonas sp.]|uniref:transcriptional regulator TbsP n=1 Tax=Natronomonas sp. TaxID=2184060 RepID=UPI0026189B4B|nr:DUF5821 family protein [Natronomonas sp.]
MNANVTGTTVADVLDSVLEAEGDRLSVVAPDAGTVEALVEAIDGDGPTVRLLSDPETLKEATDGFLIAGRTADHVDGGRLEIRTGREGSNAVVLTETAVVAIVRGHDRVAGVKTADEEIVESVGERFAAAWGDAEAYALRTPPLGRVRETLERDLGAATAEDFDAVVSSINAVRGEGALDEVDISLLVAARNEQLLYDVSKWGEDVDIASKATFSRTKKRLEEAGVIGTEKVPIEVGRPRLRLTLADEEIGEADPERLAHIAQSRLED